MNAFTLGSMYWINPKYSLEEFREDMRRIKENRLSMLRTFIMWEYVEPKRNQFDFSSYDAFFQAAEEAGIELMPTLQFYLPIHRLLEQERNGNSDAGRRYPCLDRPEIREGIELFFSETVRRYRHSPALKIWNIWNEPTDTLCQCPHSLNKYAQWLKRKYPTLEDLTHAWASEYSCFKPVFPESMEQLDADWLKMVLSLPLRGRDTALRLDWFDFQMENSAEHLAYLAGLVRKIDPDHELHSNPCCTVSNPLWQGISPWKLAEEQTSTGASIHPHHMFSRVENSTEDYPWGMLSVIDLVRSWAAGRDAWIGEYQGGSTSWKPNAYTPRASDISATLYHSLARGLKGLLFWQWQAWRSGIFEPGEFSLRNPSDGGPTERSRAAADFGAFLEQYQPYLAKLEQPHPQVAILHSMDEFAMETVVENGQRGIPFLRHFDAAYACHQAFAKAGIASEFVTESQLKPSFLGKYRLLVLPHVRIMAPATAAAIEEFVRNGGHLWADGRCAFLDKGLFLRTTVPCNGLDKVFGCREIDEVAPRNFDQLYLNDGSQVKPCREIQRLSLYEGAEALAECNGYPAAVRNCYGKGRSELWGTYLSVNLESGFAPLLTGFAAENGIQPEVKITSGSNVIVSLLHGENLLLTVFTSLAKTPQKVVAELPIQSGRIVNDTNAVLTGNTLDFTISYGQTLPLLIEARL